MRDATVVVIRSDADHEVVVDDVAAIEPPIMNVIPPNIFCSMTRRLGS